MQVKTMRLLIFMMAVSSLLLLLVFCRTETKEGHLVCSVRGYILDNRYKWVMDRSDMDYEWILIGKPDGKWYTIKETKV